MRVEERKEGNGWEGGQRNQFPVGMRVLAVDDDPTCLKVLEALLLKCQYHVTTTNAAKTALKMLRENKDGFDLVISDVHMPDMDGFTLLELVGLEMDLPVIMLSGNGERDAVMKGIQHGACDYLLKPVRVEELKNIWQHVIRRRKLDSREHNNLDDGEDSIKPHHSNSEDEQVHNGRANRKRKDQDDEEHNCENKDPATQKKARVVWSVELHRKFVVAVTQLGFDRAVPKRILDLMKVEGLTRENVASHLQKFRLYLKRLNAVANQQANIAVTFGVQDPSYLPLTSMDGFGDYHTLSASIPINAHPSFQANRINPDIVGMHGLSPGVVQACCILNTTNNPTNELNELHHISIPGNQHSHLLQGIPMELEADQSQQLKKIEDKNHFQSSCSAGLTSGSSRKPSVDVTSNSLLPQARLSSVTMPSMATGAFGMGAGVSPQLPDIGRFSETSQSAVPSTGCAANIFPVGASFSHDDLACHNIRSNVTMTNSQIHNNPANVMPSTSIVAPHYPMTGLDVQCRGSLFNGNVMLMQRGSNEDSNYLSFKRVGDSQRNFREPWKDHTSEPIIMFNPCGNPPFPGQSIVDPNVQSHRLNKRMGMNVSGQLNLSTPNPTYNCKLDKSTTDAQLKYKGRYILDNP